MKRPLFIPAVRPLPVEDNGAVAYTNSQPIMSLKDLEPDRFRYDAWKDWIKREQQKRKPNK